MGTKLIVMAPIIRSELEPNDIFYCEDISFTPTRKHKIVWGEFLASIDDALVVHLGNINPHTQYVLKSSQHWNETPSGVINGSNVAFLLQDSPDPPECLMLFKNGIKLRAGIGNDYTLTNNAISLLEALIVGDILTASYQS